MVRKFKLIDKYGREYSLNNAERTGFFTEPKGLGYSFSNSYIDIGDAFIRIKKKAKQGVISGTLVFGGRNPYVVYEKFHQFVRESQELRLIYQAAGIASSYYRDVDFVKIEKTEIEDGVLSCPVEFYCKSLFYSNAQNDFAVSSVEGELRYDITWPAKYNDYSERTIQLSNTGDVDAPFVLAIHGYCENPEAVLFKNGEVIASIKFPLTLQEDEQILYSSLDDNMYVYHVDTDGNKRNIVQLLDIAYENFFKVPTGDCGMSFMSDTGAAYTTSMTMYKFYRTV